MFHQHGKKPRPTSIKPRHDLIAVATPATLLAEGRRPIMLQNITESCALDAARFETRCVKLLHNFVNHCQRLPETTHTFYALPGGFLDQALNRTEAALHLFRDMLVQEREGAMSEEQKRWLYALFSASILQGIGKLQLDYQLDLYDMNGRKLRQWNPSLGNLTSNVSYYQYELLKDSEDDLRCRLNIVLACQLMPKSGFEWIAGDPEVYKTWLALIHEDLYSAGMLGSIFGRAKAIAIQRDLNEHLLKNTASGGGRPGRMNTFIDASSESNAERERLLGLEFIKWLTQALEKGTLLINKSPLLMTHAGLVIPPELFKLFIQEHPDAKPWQAVQKGLLAWNLHRRGAGTQAGKYGALDQVVLDNYAAILPDSVQLYHPETGETSTLSAIDLMRRQHTPDQPESLQHLSLSGEWQIVEAPLYALKSGYTQHE